jgi:hypothetical protein
MVPAVKRAKGFQDCSIEPRPHNSPPLLPDRELLQQEQPCDLKFAKLANNRQHVPTERNRHITISDSDDSENETREQRRASKPSVPKDLASNVRPACQSQQNEPSFQSSKRPFEDSIKDVENQNAKRRKSTSLISSVPRSNDESLKRLSYPDSQSSPARSYDGGNNSLRYISEGNYHTLQDCDKQKMSSEQQKTRNSAMAREALLSMGCDIPGDRPDQDGERQTNQTSGISNDIGPTKDSGGTPTLGKGEMERRGQDSNTLSEHGNAAIQVQCESTPNERSPGASRFDASTDIPSSSDTARNIAGPPMPQRKTVQGTAPSLSTTAPCNAQPLDRTQQYTSVSHYKSTSTSQSNFAGPSQQVDHSPLPQEAGLTSYTQTPLPRSTTHTAPVSNQQFSVAQSRIQASQGVSPGYGSGSFSCGIMSGQKGEQPNLARQSPQYQLQPYHRQVYFARSRPQQEPRPPPFQASLQAGPRPVCYSPNGYGAQPPDSSSPGGLPTQQVSYPDQGASGQVLHLPGHYNSHLTNFRYAFTQFDVENLPADQKKVREGWLAHFNPQVQRVLDVRLEHTFQLESIACCIRFSPDGKHVAIGSNRSAQIFDAVSGQIVCTLETDPTGRSTADMYIGSLCFSPDGKYLATGSEDTVIRVSWSQLYYC